MKTMGKILPIFFLFSVIFSDVASAQIFANHNGNNPVNLGDGNTLLSLNFTLNNSASVLIEASGWIGSPNSLGTLWLEVDNGGAGDKNQTFREFIVNPSLFRWAVSFNTLITKNLLPGEHTVSLKGQSSSPGGSSISVNYHSLVATAYPLTGSQASVPTLKELGIYILFILLGASAIYSLKMRKT